MTLQQKRRAAKRERNRIKRKAKAAHTTRESYWMERTGKAKKRAKARVSRYPWLAGWLIEKWQKTPWKTILVPSRRKHVEVRFKEGVV